MDDRDVDYGRIYGYTVCLVAILVFLFAGARLADGLVDQREPPFTEAYRNGPSLVSLEAYRVDLLSRLGTGAAGGATEALLPADSTLERMYEAERLYRLGLSRQATRRTIVVNLVLLVLAVTLFAAHWTWLQKRTRSPPSGRR